MTTKKTKKRKRLSPLMKALKTKVKVPKLNWKLFK